MRVVAVRCDRPGSRASAAGVTWTCRTAKAEWTARAWHTSVVDAAGAIYVIGGWASNPDYLNDVYASTDGGARPDSVGGWSGGTREGTRVGTQGVLRGKKGSIGGLRSTRGVLHCTKGYYRGTKGVVWVY